MLFFKRTQISTDGGAILGMKGMLVCTTSETTADGAAILESVIDAYKPM